MNKNNKQNKKFIILIVLFLFFLLVGCSKKDVIINNNIKPDNQKQIINKNDINKDSDNDGLTDEMEKQIRTDINNPDTDDDGYKDGDEVKSGYDPLTPKLQTEEWLTFINDQYNYTVSYPKKWFIIELPNKSYILIADSKDFSKGPHKSIVITYLSGKKIVGEDWITKLNRYFNSIKTNTNDFDFKIEDYVGNENLTLKKVIQTRPDAPSNSTLYFDNLNSEVISIEIDAVNDYEDVYIKKIISSIKLIKN